MKILSVKKFVSTIFILFILLFMVLLISPFIGTVDIDYHKVFDRSIPFKDNPDAVIFFKTRLPRILLAAIVGGCLACAGVIFQALLRNPLASPYTLGISSGGSLGAVIAIHLGLTQTIFGLSYITLMSFIGAVITTLFVYLLSKKRGNISVTTLLLAGVTLNFFFAAVILFIQYISDFTQSFQMIRWMMGGLDITSYSMIIGILPLILIIFIITFSLSRQLNLISIDVQTATNLGVNVERTRTILLFITSIMTGAVVSLSGPIGFIGLIIPHILRLIIGSDHRLLIPASIISGGAFLVICDTIARIILPQTEIPVGILTAICGGPFFLWLLIRKKNNFF